MAGRPAHLVERVAALLRADAGLTAPERAAEPDLGPAASPTLAAPPPNGSSPFTSAPAAPPPDPSEPLPPTTVAATLPPVGPAPLPAGVATGDAGAAGRPMVDLATLQAAGLLCLGKRTRTSEEYRVSVERIIRALRTARAGRATSGPGNLVMVTSARPGEGKSFSSLNIGASIAQNRFADVLLLDIDDKPRSLSRLLELHGARGLMDLAAAAARPEDAAVATAVEGLAVLPLGQSSPELRQVGLTRTIVNAIERMARRLPNHVVLLDAAPCLSSGDASVLAPLVDQIVMVVEAQRTQRSELEAALELVKACPNITLLLNKVQMTQRHSFGAYYYFGEEA